MKLIFFMLIVANYPSIGNIKYLLMPHKELSNQIALTLAIIVYIDKGLL